MATAGAKRYSGDLAFLYETALEFVRLPSDADIFQFAAEKLHATLEGGLLAVASYNPATDKLTTEAVVGWPRIWPKVVARLGGSPVGKKWPIDESQREEILAGTLNEIASLYEVFLGQVPHPVTNAIEKLVQLRKIYAVGLVAGGQLFGVVMIMLRKGNRIPNRELLLASINQASVALQRWHAEQELRRSEARYHTLVEEVLDPIAIVRQDGTIEEVNEACTATLGYSADQLIGMKYINLVANEEKDESRAGWAEALQSGRYVTERTICRRDGSRLVCEAHVTMLPDGRALILAYDVTERRRVESALQETRDEERRRIGHELHDSIGQQLTGIGYLCKALERDLAARSDPAAKEARRVSDLLAEAGAQVHRLTRGLSAVDTLNRGLGDPLLQLARDTEELTGIRCECTVRDEVQVPNPPKAAHLFHIAQEAIHNAVQHSGCSRVTVSLDGRGAQRMLVVRDDGRGLPQHPGEDGGMGIRIMKHRARLIGARLEIANGKSAGTVVTCTFAPDEPGTP